MIVAGVMSGTSADGVDVAVVRVTEADGEPRVKVLGHEGFAYSKAVRGAVLRAMEGEALPVAELARLNWRLGEVYADAVDATVAKLGVKVGLVAMHGQTIYHQAVAAPFLGKPVRATWQTGEASVVAERMRVPVVSDLRPADLAAGGQGAPLVPMLDYTLFRHKTKNRVLLNLGGIANVTAIPAGAGLDGVLAFDTGPANMVVDALMMRFFGKKYDAGGRVGAKGKVLGGVVAEVMKDAYFQKGAPKSCGREEYGAGFVERLVGMCGEARPEDVVATATALTGASVVEAYGRYCWTHMGQRAPLARGNELIVSGGGAKNGFLMGMLRAGLEPLGVTVVDIGERGVAAEAKEAVAFALMGWLTWNRRPGNVPAATGATMPFA
jgi:anhydro-N-acetylmuramic acid kinase